MHAEVTSVQGDVVTFAQRYAFSDGTEALSTATMRFRSEDAVRSSLYAAGFTVERIYGGWHREPVGADDGELLVVAST